jgi:hypothetical protein
MIVPVGYNVTVDINSPTYSNMVVIVNGTLTFDVGQKINICPGSFMVSATGVLDGGVPGSKINICGLTVWNGPGPDYGPLFWSSWPLPVELTAFEGSQNGTNVLLSWVTQSETNNDYFTLQRSTDGLTFENIGKVSGNGTTSQAHSYTFTDIAPVEGQNYYRLVQTDLNGQSKFWQIILVEFTYTSSDCVFSVYPNPSRGDFVVSLSECMSADNGEKFLVEVLDASGQTIMTVIPERNAKGGFLLPLNSNHALTPGTYIIRCITSTSVYQQILYVK